MTLETCPPLARGAALDVLARCDAEALKELAEVLLADLGEVEVQINRTGLVMVPMRDTVKGTDFFLGEVLVAEAQIRALGRIGYGLRAGRDLEAAMAMAVAEMSLEDARTEAFVREQAAVLAAADRDFLCAVEATRVEMETF